jgi:hypothetical protein
LTCGTSPYADQPPARRAERAQTGVDRRDRNSWATTQPRQIPGAKVFQRATEACMGGRGDTGR